MVVPFAIVGWGLASFGLGFGVARLLDIPVSGRAVVALVIGGAGLALGWFALKRLEHWLRARQLEWLDGLPFDIGVEQYLDALAIRRSTGRPVLRVEFAETLESSVREDIDGALLVGIDAEERSWSGNVVEVTGPVLSSSSRDEDNTNREHYSNARVHSWVRQSIDRGLIPVHDAHPIESVRVSIES